MTDGDCRELYLDLLKRSLTFLLWGAGDREILELQWRRPVVSLFNALKRLARLVDGRTKPLERAAGRDWPGFALTMVGMARLDNVQRCVESVLEDQVPGDLLEAGVWRGGVTIFMRGVLRAFGVTDRVVWAADSFEGLPRPTPEDYPEDRHYDLSMYRSLAISQDEVMRNFERFGLLDDQVKFLSGWFKNTLPRAPVERLAVLRLDADLYESTMDALVNLYPKLSVGGYLIIDDYRNAPPCRKAVDDFRSRYDVRDPLEVIDWSAVYWRKSERRAGAG